MSTSHRLLILLTLLLTTSCSSSDKDDELDRLWKQGYGFNNPNLERIEKGLPPKSF